MALYLRLSVETMITLILCLLVVSSKKVTNSLENQMDKVLASSLQVEVGYIFPEELEITIKNNFTDSDVKLEYSKIKMDDSNDIEESGVTTIIKMGNKTIDMLKLTKLDPKSTYKICAIVNESNQEIYACEMATTFNHVNHHKGLVTGVVGAIVAVFSILLIVGFVRALRIQKRKKFNMEKSDPSCLMEHPQISVINTNLSRPDSHVQKV